MNEIYNEGRVVGLSQYEIYVRHHLSENPTVAPATELEWLSSSIAFGTSLLVNLKLATQTEVAIGESSDTRTAYCYTVKLPETHKLCAANTVIGSLFIGKGYNGNNAPICTKVTDYGMCIDNSSSTNNDVKVGQFTGSQISMIRAYSKIFDGGVVINKNYIASGTTPSKDVKPDLYSGAEIRIFSLEPITSDLYVLLSGFTYKSVISGVTGLDGSVNTSNAQSGDFLGPTLYPWANKIVFSVPPAYTSFYSADSFKRAINSKPAKAVNTDALIDMEEVNPSTYYNSHPNDNKNKPFAIPAQVIRLSVSGDGASVITTYSYDENDLPPAIFGSRVSSTGQTKLYPLDVVAPGTVKMFDSTDSELAKKIETTIPGNHSIVKDDDGQLSTFDNNGQLQPVAKTYVTNTNNKPTTHVEVGKNHTKSISLQNASGQDLPITDRTTFGTSSPELGDKPLTWNMLLQMLSTDKGIDILGEALRKLRSKLPDIDTTGIGQGVLKLSGTGTSSIGGPLTTGGGITASGNVNGNNITANNGYTVKSGKNYITFENGNTDLRLYISATKPTDTDVPIGSIGIGWPE